MSTQVQICPVCRQPAQHGQAPFCSQRCREVDLHRWLGGAYSLPTDEAPESPIAPETPGS